MIERIHERQHTPHENRPPNHWLIPAAGALRIAGAGVDIVTTCVVLMMILNNDSENTFSEYSSILTALMGFPALIVLTRALVPYERAAAMRALAAGGSCYLILLGFDGFLAIPAFNVLLDTMTFSLLKTAATVVVALWVIWLVWSARLRGILQGALPWFGIATNIGVIIYAVTGLFRRAPGFSDAALGLIVLCLLVVYVLGTAIGVVWDVWLGIALMRGKIRYPDITSG